LQCLIVPEPKYSVAPAFKKASAAHLLFRQRVVLAAVNLDDQFRLMADKIGNKNAPTALDGESDNLRFGARAA
jgi:hypothetical protein